MWHRPDQTGRPVETTCMPFKTHLKAQLKIEERLRQLARGSNKIKTIKTTNISNADVVAFAQVSAPSLQTAMQYNCIAGVRKRTAAGLTP